MQRSKLISRAQLIIRATIEAVTRVALTSYMYLSSILAKIKTLPSITGVFLTGTMTIVAYDQAIAINGAITKATTLINLTRIFNDGPAVSLNGSPTVSPTTAALCASEPFS